MGEARTPDEREAVFRFWYSVYVDEMGRYRNAADHVRRLLRDDPEDDHSRIVYAREDSEVVAACRLNWGGDGFSERQIRQYQLEPFLAEISPETMSIGERTMVAASHRGTAVYVDLANTVTPIADELGILLSFGGSEPHLVSYYSQFGQRPYARRQSYSQESGYVVPTLALPKGIEPFGADLPLCVAAALEGSPTVRNAGVDGDERYVAALRQRVASARGAGSLFAGLTDAEVERCAVRGTLLTCAAGDQVLKRDGTARNPFVVLAGRLGARGADGDTTQLGPGDLFGESGWLGDRNREADVWALDEGTEILALSNGGLRDVESTDPALAARLLANVAGQLAARLRRRGLATG